MTRGTYLDLAAATQRGCSSEITPFPIGVGRNGNLHLSTNSWRGFSAHAYAAPAKGNCISYMNTDNTIEEARLL